MTRAPAGAIARVLAACWLLACSRDVATGARCSADEGCQSGANESSAGRTPGGESSGPAAGAGATSRTAVDRSDEALSVRVQNIQQMTIEVITLACAGECADVEAVAHGGNPPYAFAWEDGSSDPRRHVCLDASSQLVVTTTDTAIVADELGYEARSASARVTATVLDCSDGGPPPTDSLPCLTNPSFEGTVTPTQFEAFDAPPWNACYQGGLTYAAIADPGLWPAQNWDFPAPSDGATYLALGQQALFAGQASQVLCEPIAAGEARAFFVDLARGTTSDPGESQDQVMQVVGGSQCAEDEVLWTSPQLTLDWQRYCVTVRPQRALTSLGFRPLGADGGLMEGLVDHIEPVASCP